MAQPSPPWPVPRQTTRLEEARRLLLRADSALRAGDWVTFGRTWDMLRKSFGIQTESETP